jgi:hypothetical protein
MVDLPGDAAREGTECHEAASAILEGTEFDVATRGLTNEQILLVEEYVESVRFKYRALQKTDKGARLIVERRMRAPNLHPDYHGTGDTLLIARRVLHVDDLKCGWSPVAVRAANGTINAQLGSYVLLALAELGLDVSPWSRLNIKAGGLERVHLTVHQPRVYDRPESTDLSEDELEEFKWHVLDAIERVEQGDPTRKAGSWCKFCLAKGRCPTLRTAANKAAAADFNESVENFSLEEMARILQEADLIDLQVKGAKEAVFRALRVGRHVDGSKLVEKKKRKAWTDWDRAERIGKSLGIPVDSLYRRQPISPAQFITLVKVSKLAGEIDWKMLDQCFTSESSGYTLVAADDPREAAVIRPGDDFPDDAET